MKKLLLISATVLTMLLSVLSISCVGSMTKYTVSLGISNEGAGEVFGGGEYRYLEEINIKAEDVDENKYDWDGWYLNDKLYTKEKSFTYTVQARNIKFEAKWSGALSEVYCYSIFTNGYTNVSISDILFSYKGDNKVEYGTERSFEVINDSEKTLDECVEEMKTTNKCDVSNVSQDIIHYKFLGWYTDPSLTNKFCDDSALIEFTTLKYLYAKWEAKEYTLTINTNSKLASFDIVIGSSNKVTYNYRSTYEISAKYNSHYSIEISNSGIDNGQICEKDEKYLTIYTEQNISKSNNDTKLDFDIIQNTTIDITYNIVDLNFEYEYDYKNNGYKVVNYFGDSEIVRIPLTFTTNLGSANVISVGTYAFEDFDGEVIINKNIITLDDLKNVKAKICFEDGSDLSLINSNTFDINNSVYVNVYDLYDRANQRIKDLPEFVDGTCVIFNGTIVLNTISSQEDYDAVKTYIYLNNINAGNLNYKLGTNVSDTHNKILSLYNNFSDCGIKIESCKDNMNMYYFKLTLNDNYYNIATEHIEDYNENIAKNYGISSKKSETLLDGDDYITSFAIENSNYMICRTSEQVLYAIENGYRPEFLEECSSKNVYNTAIQILKSILKVNMSDYDKALAIYDYILTNTSIYNQSGIIYRSANLEGAVIDKICHEFVLKQYYSLLLSIAGVENSRYLGSYRLDYTSGETSTKEKAIIWNKIKINDCWYNSVITRDIALIGNDTKNSWYSNMHANFLLNDSELTFDYDTNGTTITYLVESNSDYVCETNNSMILDYYENSKLKFGEMEFSLYINQDVSSENFKEEYKNLYGALYGFANDENKKSYSIDFALTYAFTAEQMNDFSDLLYGATFALGKHYTFNNETIYIYILIQINSN